MSDTNREIRRKQIMKVVVNLVAHEGVDALTVRRVAAEVGYSTTVVTYYFKNKADLVHSFGTLLAQHERNELQKYLSAEPVDLIGFLASKTEATDINIAWWRYFFVVWSRILREPDVSQLMADWLADSLAQLGELIVAVYPHCTDTTRIALHLTALTEGISLRRHIVPNLWSDEEVRNVLQREIEFLIDEQ